MSSSEEFFDRKLCNGLGMCAMDDPLTVSDDELTPALFESLVMNPPEPFGPAPTQ
mgnify:CR=1 FL=1